jgi:hypothetical protein
MELVKTAKMGGSLLISGVARAAPPARRAKADDARRCAGSRDLAQPRRSLSVQS